MGRNYRGVRNWKPEQVSDFEVAPHRYRFDRLLDDTDIDSNSVPIREWMKTRPYQPGDVIYFIDFRKVDGVFQNVALRGKIDSISVDYDQYGDRREAYRVQPETKAGVWSKSWKLVHPGPIQRGYQMKGLAPEMPDE